MDRMMADHNQGRDENPLDEYASQASRELGGRATDVNNSSVDRVESGQVSLRESFAQSVQASATYMEDAAAGIVRTGALEAKDVSIGVAMANSVRADTLQSGLLAAREIDAREMRTGIVFAGSIRGDVHSAVSPLAGMAIGIGIATTLVAARLALRLLARRMSNK